MTTSTIRIRGVHKSFDSPDPTAGTVRAVDGLDLDIRSGEIVAILGPNGAGKTTTLDMVLGFTEPTTGEIAVLGGPPHEAIAAGRVAAVLQTGGLLRDLTIRETIDLIASTHIDPKSPDNVIERAGLTAVQHQRVQSCSGGEQQRLRFALALLGDPDLLILDEPTTGMDVQARHEFWAAMREEADAGRTIVFATHYLQEAEDFAERTVLMANGRIVADGATDEVRRRASGRRVRARFAPQQIENVVRLLDDLPEVGRVRVEHNKLVVDTTDSDAVARIILGPLDGTDVEIEAASLEHAFIQLTTTHGAAA
ncbi:MAG: ABC transporter ATP-binding protein [Acidimicrobiales bacterium]